VKKLDFNLPAKRKKTVYYRIFGSGLINALFIVQGILLVPLYINHLGDRLYGFWLATGGMLAWLAMFDIGASFVTQQRCAAAFGKKDLAEVANYFWHGLLVTLGVISVLLLTLFGIGSSLIAWVGVDPEYTRIISLGFYITGACVGGSLANDFMLNVASALQRGHFSVFVEAFGNTLGLIAIFVLLVFYNLGLWALVIGAVIRCLVSLIFNIFHTSYIVYSLDQRFVWSPALMRDYMVTTPSILLSKSSWQLVKSLPVILLARFISPEATVIYTVTGRALQIVSGLINHLSASMFAACTHFFHDDSVSGQRIREVVGLLSKSFFYATASTATLYVLLNKSFVSLWTGEEFFAGQWFTSLSALALYIVQSNLIYAGLAGALGEIKKIELARSVENILSSGLLCLFIYFFGIIGVPIAAITSGLLFQFYYYHIIESKREDVAIPLRKLLYLCIPLVLVFALAYPLASHLVADNWWLFIGYGAALTIPFAIPVYFIFPEIKNKLYALLHGLVKKRAEV